MDLSAVAQSILVYLYNERADSRARVGDAIRVGVGLDRHSAYQALDELKRAGFVRLRDEIYELTGEGQNMVVQDEPLNDPRLRAVFQELAALETNGGVHLRDYFNLKYRYPELNSEIDAAMLIQLAQAQHKMGERLDRVERTVQRIRRDMLLLFSSPVLAAVALLLILAVRG
jgi:hypothetical protein